MRHLGRLSLGLQDDHTILINQSRCKHKRPKRGAYEIACLKSVLELNVDWLFDSGLVGSIYVEELTWLKAQHAANGIGWEHLQLGV